MRFKFGRTGFGYNVYQLIRRLVEIVNFVVPWNDGIGVDHLCHPKIHHKLHPAVEYRIIEFPGSV